MMTLICCRSAVVRTPPPANFRHTVSIVDTCCQLTSFCAVSNTGISVLIMPKTNSVARAKGHLAWRNMIKFYHKAYK